MVVITLVAMLQGGLVTSARPAHAQLVPVMKPRAAAERMAVVRSWREQRAPVPTKAPVSAPDRRLSRPSGLDDYIPGLEIVVVQPSDLPVVAFDHAEIEPAGFPPSRESELLERGRLAATSWSDPDLDLVRGLVRAWEGLGMVARALGDEEEARWAYQQVLRQYDLLSPSLARTTAARDGRLSALTVWTDMSFRLGMLADAELGYEEIAEHRISAADSGVAGADWQAAAAAMLKLATVRQRMSRSEGSWTALDAARGMTKAMLADGDLGRSERAAFEKQLRYIEGRMIALRAGRANVAPAETEMEVGDWP